MRSWDIILKKTTENVTIIITAKIRSALFLRIFISPSIIVKTKYAVGISAKRKVNSEITDR